MRNGHGRMATMALLYAAGTLSTFCAALSFCDSPGWAISWREEFDDAESWRQHFNVELAPPQNHTMHCKGKGCAALGSCREAACTEDSVYVHDGKLVLESNRASAGGYRTGAVNTWGKASWRAGEGTFRACISAQLPGSGYEGGRSQGLWPAHWFMPMDNTCDPDEGETDFDRDVLTLFLTPA